MGHTKRTTIWLNDDRQRLIDQAKELVADGPNDDPPMSDVIDAALTHLLESEENLRDVRSELPN